MSLSENIRTLLEDFTWGFTDPHEESKVPSAEPKEWSPDKLIWRLWMAVRQARNDGKMTTGGPWWLIYEHHSNIKKQSPSEVFRSWYTFLEPMLQGIMPVTTPEFSALEFNNEWDREREIRKYRVGLKRNHARGWQSHLILTTCYSSFTMASSTLGPTFKRNLSVRTKTRFFQTAHREAKPWKVR